MKRLTDCSSLRKDWYRFPQMPLLDVVLERFLAASEVHADQDLAAVYEV